MGKDKANRKHNQNRGRKQGLTPEAEAAQKTSQQGKELRRQGRSSKGLAQTERAVQNWIQQLDTRESGARPREDLVSTDYRGEDILDAVAEASGMERIDLEEVDFTPELIEEIPEEVARKYRVVPVRSTDDEIYIALSDPHNIEVLDDLSRILNKKVFGMIAGEDEIEKVVRRYYDTEDLGKYYDQLAESDDPMYDRKWEDLSLSEEEEGEQQPVVKFVDLLFKKAVHERASDIHVEPTRQGVTIRFRIDGVLQEVPSPPVKWRNALISRLKVLANLDLAEKRVPLDGRIKLNLSGRKLDLRVSTLPTIFGESVVMRLLEQSQVLLGLEDVGFLPNHIKIFNELIHSPNGIILMRGPTGSGKTTTLYAALGMLNTPDNKLVTLEDPVEYQITGINQVQIHPEIGLTFAAGLRSLLRQSPDVILVGEIRDLETGENAIRAALTGHLVFSTLHTNDAPSSTTRLIDMGVKPYLVASSLQAAIAQRLVRRICSSCKGSVELPEQALRESGYDPDDYQDREFFAGQGCERCNQTGYRGRTAIHEIMVMNADIRRRVLRSEPGSRIKRAAIKSGMRTLRDSGVEKACMGITTLEEVLRITQQD